MNYINLIVIALRILNLYFIIISFFNAVALLLLLLIMKLTVTSKNSLYKIPDKRAKRYYTLLCILSVLYGLLILIANQAFNKNINIIEIIIISAGCSIDLLLLKRYKTRLLKELNMYEVKKQ